MIKKGVYAASLSVINQDGTLNIGGTINHAVDGIKNGLHGVFFFGSTGQSQLISMAEKKELVAKLPLSKFKKNFYSFFKTKSFKISWCIYFNKTYIFMDIRQRIA